MIEQFTSKNMLALWATSQVWLFKNVLNFNTVYQVIIILAAALFSYFIYKIFRKKTRKLIEDSKLPMRYKRIAYNIHRLLFQAVTLITIQILQHVLESEMVGMNVWMLNGITKTLMAWIGIRVMVQLIDNSVVRGILSASICLAAALSIFGVLDETREILKDISFEFGTFHISLLVVVTGAFYLFVLIHFALVITSLIERRIAKSTTLTGSTKLLFAKILRISLVAVALIMGLLSSGVDLSLFAVFGGAIGLGIGFGLQRSISNLFSGIMLLLDRSIEPGDIIELQNGTFGWVTNMAGRYTEIITGDNKAHLIPNEELVTQSVINWSHGDTKIMLSVNFGVHYKSNPHDVIKIALKAAQKTKRVLKKPEATCCITEFGDNAINFSLGFWIEDAQNGVRNVKGDVLLALWDLFKENNIEIPYPHREIYIHNMDNPALPQAL